MESQVSSQAARDFGDLSWPSFSSFFSLRGEPSVTFLFFIFSLFLSSYFDLAGIPGR